jgi:hypothetical protein
MKGKRQATTVAGSQVVLGEGITMPILHLHFRIPYLQAVAPPSACLFLQKALRYIDTITELRIAYEQAHTPQAY